MLKLIKFAALGLVATSTVLSVAPPVNAAISRNAEKSVVEIQSETPKEELVAGRYRTRRVYRRGRVYRRRRPRRRYRVRKIYRRRYRRPFRIYRRRTCYYKRNRRVCRYRTYRRY
ncbi:hypothetical protein Riv7116_5753 [Rivularia sp. PCC 7116]|uniref:hypothetical protein n=1 Tax=Rivularia sp. PCC 7116 TaxID=373994 RepID=UPI00029EEB29|nr:hypothetical protein [Rivularia sp. PCC 7116]AFY58119.1 hypothetical protein Riv7116_5753 [Rivularia sp. PCC 7116]